MQRVLKIHQNYPANQALLKGKQPTEVDRKSPEEFRALSGFQKELDYDGQVAKSCIHCHQVRDARRKEIRAARRPLPDHLLYPYPSPQLLGIQWNIETAQQVDIAPQSMAQKAGLRSGDRIIGADGQRIVSEADFRWVLHQPRDEPASLPVEVLRGQKRIEAKLQLSEGWRRKSDIAWRVSTWDLRRMGLGGMVLVPAGKNIREKQNIPATQMLLRVQHTGKYGEHAGAHRAGIRPGDLIVSFDQRSNLLTEADVLAYATQIRRPGDSVKIEFLRGNERRQTTIQLR